MKGKLAVITSVAETLVLDVDNSIDGDYWGLFVDESYVTCYEHISEEEDKDGEVPRRGLNVQVRSTANLQLIWSIWIEREPVVYFGIAEYSNGLFMLETIKREDELSNDAAYLNENYQ